MTSYKKALSFRIQPEKINEEKYAVEKRERNKKVDVRKYVFHLSRNELQYLRKEAHMYLSRIL